MAESGRKGLLRAAGVITLATMLSRVLGFARDLAMAAFFGAGGATDAFVVAFRLPNTLRRFFGEGALTISFVPVFTESLDKDGPQEAQRVARITLTMLLMALAVVVALGILGAKYVVYVTAPGFADDPEQFELTVRLLRITFGYILLVSICAWSMGILNSFRHFFAPAFSPVILNVFMIGAIVAGGYYYGEAGIDLVAWGVLVGGAVQVLFQLPFLFKYGNFLGLDFDFKRPAVRKMLALLGPSLFGVAVYQVNIIVTNQLASLLPQGGLSYLFYAQRFFELPLGLFAVALGTAVLPFLSEYAAKQQLDEFSDTVGYGVRLLLTITIPAAVGLACYSDAIFTTFYRRGAFDLEAAMQTSWTLQAYIFGLPFLGVTRILAPSFLAMQDSKTPVVAAFYTFIINALFSVLLMSYFDHIGLALATSISSVFNCVYLLLYLRRSVPPIGARRITITALKVSLACVPMAAIAWYGGKLEIFLEAAPLLTLATLSKLSALTGGIALAAAAFVFTAWLLKTDEVLDILGIVGRKLKRKKA